jgi:hypothetical protein
VWLPQQDTPLFIDSSRTQHLTIPPPQAAANSNRSPRQISFTAAMQKIAAGWTVSPLLDEAGLIALITNHLRGLPQHRVGHRPDRVEPRAIKRRPKPHKLLTVPRNQARAQLLVGNSM